MLGIFMSNSYELQFWKKYWTAVTAMDRAWAANGQSLITAFEVLVEATDDRFRHTNLMNHAYMLAGMAIEVMLKSIIVNNSENVRIVTTPIKQLTESEKVVRKNFYSHNLLELANLASLNLNDEQNRVARILSEFITWRGRYLLPSMNSVEEIMPKKHSDGLIHITPEISVDEVRGFITFVIDHVKHVLYQNT
jgi:hypothetical protein